MLRHSFRREGRLFFCSILCPRFELTAHLQAQACKGDNKGSKCKEGTYKCCIKNNLPLPPKGGAYYFLLKSNSAHYIEKFIMALLIKMDSRGELGSKVYKFCLKTFKFCLKVILIF